MAALTETKAQLVALGRIFCFGDESVGKLLPLCSDCGPGAVQQKYKSQPFSSLSHPVLLSPSHWEQGKVEDFSALPPSILLPSVFCTYLPLCSMPGHGAAYDGRGTGTERVQEFGI